jgi:urea carboxylase
VRINGEDPAKDFQPAPGLLGEVAFPQDVDGVRVDTWVEAGTEISPYYDSLLGKLMVHAPTRAAAIAKMRDALDGACARDTVFECVLSVCACVPDN